MYRSIQTALLAQRQYTHQYQLLQMKYKHKMVINQTISIGILKNDLIYIILEKDKEKQKVLFNNLYNDISKNLIPVRPGMHYKRIKGQLHFHNAIG